MLSFTMPQRSTSRPARCHDSPKEIGRGTSEAMLPETTLGHIGKPSETHEAAMRSTRDNFWEHLPTRPSRTNTSHGNTPKPPTRKTGRSARNPVVLPTDARVKLMRKDEE